MVVITNDMNMMEEFLSFNFIKLGASLYKAAGKRNNR